MYTFTSNCSICEYFVVDWTILFQENISLLLKLFSTIWWISFKYWIYNYKINHLLTFSRARLYRAIGGRGVS